MTIKITLLTEDDLEVWLDSNEASRGQAHMHRLIRFWQDMQEGKRAIWAAWEARGQDEIFLGHISLQAISHYPPFKKYHIPEIVDLWVQPEARRRNIGQRLLLKAIEIAKEAGAPAIGMGVGLTSHYGAAHLLYAKQGFMPDGTGLWVNGAQAREEERVMLGPDAILMWVKKLA